MRKIFFLIFVLFCALISGGKVSAASSSYVTIVNPVRGGDFWEGDQTPVTVVQEQIKILDKHSLPSTFLIRFDALANQDIISLLKTTRYEKGLFLEVTPSWTKQSNVQYRQSASWHSAGSVFLTGYSPQDREKLIDSSFEEFKKIYGIYPASVGAWWIDAYSLSYMQNKYKITSALIVADQYSTDNYQIWGQYWGLPYYPYNKNALMPARNTQDQIDVVMMQWAPRDPVNGYGKGVEESTYSVQANDYIDYHKLNNEYFSSLIDTYTNQSFNQINQIVVGLENTYSWEKYGAEYQKQLQILKEKSQKGQFKVTTMQEFGQIYRQTIKGLSPQNIIVTNDPLGSDYKSVWIMNPYYRVGWFYNKNGSVIRDVRQYVDGTEEPCLLKQCDKLNFATFATRVLDDVTYKQSKLIDVGKISNFEYKKDGENFVLSYINAGGKQREIAFLPRDIGIDNKINTIDGFILDAQKLNQQNQPSQISSGNNFYEKYKENLLSFLGKTLIFIIFIFFGIIVPGYVLTKPVELPSRLERVFLSFVLGLVLFTFLSFVFSLIKLPFLIYLYILFSLLIFIRTRSYKSINFKNIFSKGILILFTLTGFGTFFQTLSSVRSGWIYDFGIGYLGPLGHDGIWHQSLINELIKNVPPQNPTFAGNLLSNYHYFYDLLVAATYRMTSIPVLDLLYRGYPVIFSMLLGVGTYCLVRNITPKNLTAFIAVFLAYFGSSFGWIVDMLKNKQWAGESNFWANQPVSFNLNPPFAVSLIILIAVLILLKKYILNQKLSILLLLVLSIGTLVEFKVYAAIVLMIGLGIVSVQELIIKRRISLLKVVIPSSLFSALLFFPQNKGSSELLVYSPFWFITSAVDFSDRVGWERLSQARQAYLARGEWLKYLLVQALSLVLFIAGNLGTRTIGFLLIIVFFAKSLWKNLFFSLLFSISIAALLIPILFIQKGNPWNTIQFLYYFLYLFAIFAAIVITAIFYKLPRIFGIILILAILIITPISSFATFKDGFYPYPPSRLTLEEFEALEFLKNQPEGVVLTVPFDKSLREQFVNPYPLLVYETTSYVSAFSSKPSFIEDEIQHEILQTDYQRRIVGAHNFFSSQDANWSEEFLTKSNIEYIYLPKLYPYSLSEEKLPIKKIFENKEVEVYQVIR